MRIVHWILPLTLVLGQAQTVTPQDSQQSRVLSLENAWNHGVQQHDMKALDLLLDNDLVYIDYDGRLMNKAQYFAMLSLPKLRIERVVSDSMQVQLYGTTAVVLGVYRESGTKDGHPYVRRERFVDSWVNRNGAWKCVASQSTLILH